MLNGKSGNRIVESITIKDINLNLHKGLSVLIPKNSIILVDLDEQIARYEDYHFDISLDEYKIIEGDFFHFLN